MNANRDKQGLQQQPNDAQRQQADQQNQQGEASQREDLEETDQDQLSVGGVDAGEGLRPGRTGDGGAER
jgi:hypothetical protein